MALELADSSFVPSLQLSFLLALALLLPSSSLSLLLLLLLLLLRLLLWNQFTISPCSGATMPPGTPGRLLQHMDETPLFTCDNLQALVLDEADRIMDLGFERTLNAILANLPPGRQTMVGMVWRRATWQTLEG